MYTIKTILLVGLIGFINFSFLSNTNTNLVSNGSNALKAFNQELCAAYNVGENIILVDKNGTQHFNPNKEDLQKMDPEFFDQNRVRVTLTGRSDNDLCSTELVVMGETGSIIGNYSVNSCSSYGWIFFTPSECFDVALFHDAGLEAPYGNSINGSVDWSFQFNDNSRITGTYMDMGAANMFKVASPCYSTADKIPMSAGAAKMIDSKRRSSPLGN